MLLVAVWLTGLCASRLAAVRDSSDGEGVLA
jgi:hypothetical protein